MMKRWRKMLPRMNCKISNPVIIPIDSILLLSTSPVTHCDQQTREFESREISSLNSRNLYCKW